MNYSSWLRNQLHWVLFMVFVSAMLLLGGLIQPDAPWLVRNEQTGKAFPSIQAAIDDSTTQAGHTILVNSVSYDSSLELGECPGFSCLILINKSITLRSTGGAKQTILGGGSFGTVVQIIADDVTFEGFTIAPTEERFPLNTGILIQLNDPDEGEIRNVRITKNIIRGIETTGIRAERNVGSEISSNRIENSPQGIVFESSKDSSIANNTLINSAIADNFGSNNRIESNTLSNEGKIFIQSSKNVVVENNVMESEFEGGIQAELSQSLVIRSNRVQGGAIGIDVFRSSETLIENNSVSGMFEFGIAVNENRKSMIMANFSEKNAVGIAQLQTDETHVEANVLVGNAIGLKVENSNRSVFSSNHFENNRSGIELYSAHSNIVRQNQLSFTTETAISIFNSPNNEISNNMLQNSEGGILLRESTRNQINTNTLNTFTDVAILLAGGSDINTLNDNHILNATQGILLTESVNGNTLNANDVSDGRSGIVIQSGRSNRLLNNIVRHQTEQGFLLENSLFNELEANQALENLIGIEVRRGIRNTLTDTLFQRNQLGLLLSNTDDNAIDGERFVDNVQNSADVLFAENELMVKFHTQVPTVVIQALIRNLNTEVIPPYPFETTYHLRILDGQDTITKVEAFNRLPEVVVAEINALWTVHASAQAQPDQSTSRITPGHPNDPTFEKGALWNLSAIGAVEAWEQGFIDSSNIAIGIIDTGVDTLHPDLKNNIVLSQSSGENALTLNEMTDETGHGTFLTGLMAAVGDNGIAGTGINWRAQLINIKISSTEGFIKASDFRPAVEEVLTAVHAGYPIRVVNFSHGGPGCFLNIFYSCNVIPEDPIKLLAQAGILFVTSAGNEGRNNDEDPIFPCNYESDNILCVAAANDDVVLEHSNYGKNSVHVAAPGRGLVSLMSTTLEHNLYAIQSNGSLEGFFENTSTSFAAAHATGIAALLFSKYPEASYRQIKQLILNSVQPVETLSDEVISGGLLHWPQQLPDEL